MAAIILILLNLQTTALCVVIRLGKSAVIVYLTSQLALPLLYTFARIVPGLHMDQLLNVTNMECPTLLLSLAI